LRDQIRHVLKDFPGLTVAFTQPIQMRVDEMLTGVRGDLAIKVFGDDSAAINTAARQIRATVAGIDGAAEVYVPAPEGQRYLVFDIDRLAAGRLGLSVASVADVLRAQLEGMRVGTVYRGDQRQPLMIRASHDRAVSAEQLSATLITLEDGRRIPLSSVVSAQEIDGPVVISRDQGSRLVPVIANVTGRDLVGFVEEAQAAVATLDLPVGVYLEWGGEFENQQRASARLLAVVPLTLALVFLILFVTLGSVPQALLVLGMIPLALVGGVFALALTGEYLSVPASVGFIALLGIAVMNGVVLITHFNHLVIRGNPIDRVVREGSLRRLRPVLTTASITAVGLVPLTFASGPGAEVQRPLAIVVIGGVITSTLLTLVVLPVLYRWLHIRSAS
jgi:cobalt-zinc-cadmium resistance protein CzcA